jgi:N-acetylmuramoyl-L-alanine amidase
MRNSGWHWLCHGLVWRRTIQDTSRLPTTESASMKRTITDIIIHCSASPNGKSFSAADVNSWHKTRGFKRNSQFVRSKNPELPNIGYHYVIGTDGKVETGRGLEEVGAHVQGSNAFSIGICMIGTDQFSNAQWVSLRALLIELAGTIKGKAIATCESALHAYKEMGISVKGHRDHSPDKNGNGIIERNEWLKICPGFSVSEWIKGGMMPITYG